MSRSVGGTLGILLAATTLASAQEDGPPLSPPALEPPPAASSPLPSAGPASKPAARRPFLVIPGVNAPAAFSGRAAPSPAVDSEPNSAIPPPLAGPEPAGRLEPIAPTVTMPLTLEPIPENDETDDPPRAKAPVSARPRTAAAASTPVGSEAAPRAFPGSVLGRLLGFDDGRDDVKSAVSIESKSDPAVDAAVKRRIEKAVKESLGDRASEVEVRVQGRNVLIRARASRFWHRRGVRRSLDSLQLPSGYHGRSELID